MTPKQTTTLERLDALVLWTDAKRLLAQTGLGLLVWVDNDGTWHNTDPKGTPQ